MNAMLFAYLIVGAPSFSIDANLATLLGLVVTSLTSIALAVING
jgi:hypothetical protein